MAASEPQGRSEVASTRASPARVILVLRMDEISLVFTAEAMVCRWVTDTATKRHCAEIDVEQNFSVAPVTRHLSQPNIAQSCNASTLLNH
ncbi:hypothetical protein SDC9_187980 [bioreactor metagenome]|uniref:Uncharacterized protein n=1 Tax=bioreactor metagenome TaxID=1076179 RepID=A0A645HYS0_9ZZZZ